MADLFGEILPSILKTKKNALTDPQTVKEYMPFVVNRALSFHVDCIPYVNDMNMYPGLDKDVQYQYLLNTIRPMSRKFQKWQKAEVYKDLECVKQYFGYSNEKAKQALRILTEEQLVQIRTTTNTGGINNDRNTGSS
jgi:hypothetical protein